MFKSLEQTFSYISLFYIPFKNSPTATPCTPCTPYTPLGTSAPLITYQTYSD
jgi:hypothetical protein